MKKRKNISQKLRLQILERDLFTCHICGKSPALYPELQIDVVRLEIDHFQPYSKNGSDEIDNLQTLCISCNRGKGNDERLNQTVEDKINILLNEINPEILTEIEINKQAQIVANDSEYQELSRLNNLHKVYDITVIPSTIFGYHAMYNAGIYTFNDNHAGKVNFVLQKQ